MITAGAFYDAGATNTTRSNNTFLGTEADATSGSLNYATAIGSEAKVTTSNNMILGTNNINVGTCLSCVAGGALTNHFV